jgi:ferrochelatase
MNLNAEKAIILTNLGSPDSPSVPDVRRYLNEFLMDERVLDKGSWLFRTLLVKGLITPFRAPKSAHAYQTVWTKEGSPLIVISRQLQAAVQAQTEYPVELAMRYGNPSQKEAFDRLAAKMPNLKEVVLLPLYPHYAMSSYETAVVHAQNIHKKYNYPFALTVIPPYFEEPQYIHAMSENMKPYLQQDYDHILFSFHGIPQRHVTQSDPTGKHCFATGDCCAVDSEAHATCYRHQCLQTMHLVAAELNIPKDKYSFAFQSRLGREPWLKPYTDFRLAELPAEGVKKLLVLCPAFVSDCLETLEEIEMRGKEIFIEAGGTDYHMIPCMNVHPAWVSAVAGWINK